jgi:hypothetical protein
MIQRRSRQRPCADRPSSQPVCPQARWCSKPPREWSKFLSRSSRSRVTKPLLTPSTCAERSNEEKRCECIKRGVVTSCKSLAHALSSWTALACREGVDDFLVRARPARVARGRARIAEAAVFAGRARVRGSCTVFVRATLLSGRSGAVSFVARPNCRTEAGACSRVLPGGADAAGRACVSESERKGESEGWGLWLRNGVGKYLCRRQPCPPRTGCNYCLL